MYLQKKDKKNFETAIAADFHDTKNKWQHFIFQEILLVISYQIFSAYLRAPSIRFLEDHYYFHRYYSRCASAAETPIYMLYIMQISIYIYNFVNSILLCLMLLFFIDYRILHWNITTTTFFIYIFISVFIPYFYYFLISSILILIFICSINENNLKLNKHRI